MLAAAYFFTVRRRRPPQGGPPFSCPPFNPFSTRRSLYGPQDERRIPTHPRPHPGRRRTRVPVQGRGQHHHERYRRFRGRVPGRRLRPLQEQDRCLHRHVRPGPGGSGVADPRVDRRRGAGSALRVDAPIRADLRRGRLGSARAGNPLPEMRAQRRERAPSCAVATCGSATPCARPRNCCAPPSAAKTCRPPWTCACPMSTCIP